MESRVSCEVFSELKKFYDYHDDEFEDRENIYVGKYKYIRETSMEEPIKISYKDFKRIWKRIPIAERKMPIVIVDNKVFTWKQSLDELKKDTVLAEEIRRKFSRKIVDEINEEIWILTKARIKEMPSTLQIAILGKLLKKEDILDEINRRTEIGKTIANMQVEYLRYFLRPT